MVATGEQPVGNTTAPLVPEGVGPLGFLARANQVQHPMERPPWLPRRMVQAIEMILQEGEHMEEFREDEMAKIRRWALELEPLRLR